MPLKKLAGMANDNAGVFEIRHGPSALLLLFHGVGRDDSPLDDVNQDGRPDKMSVAPQPTSAAIRSPCVRISAHRGRHFRLIVDGISA
jgi:predicted esterase